MECVTGFVERDASQHLWFSNAEHTSCGAGV